MARKQAAKKQKARTEAAADPERSAKRQKMWWEEELEADKRYNPRENAEEDAAYFREEVSQQLSCSQMS